MRRRCAQVTNPVARPPSTRCTISSSPMKQTPHCLSMPQTPNSLNRAAALHNVRVICPIIAIYAINTYRAPARLFIIGEKELKSSEETTQGDPLAMSLYAISLQTLITLLSVRNSAKQLAQSHNRLKSLKVNH